MAASIELQEQQQDFIYSLIALGMKLGLVAIGIVSLLKLGFASHQRINRHSEISSVLKNESTRSKWLYSFLAFRDLNIFSR